MSFSGQVVFPVDLSHTTLYSGTVFTLSCLVTLVEEVDTSVSVLTDWTRDGKEIDTDSGRITVDSQAVQSTSNMSLYESHVVFDPLSRSGDGVYSCSVTIEDSEFVSGNMASDTQNIPVDGKCCSLHVRNYVDDSQNI